MPNKQGYSVLLELGFGESAHAPESGEEYWFPTLEGAYAFAIEIADDWCGYLTGYTYSPTVYDEDTGDQLTGWEAHHRALNQLEQAEAFFSKADRDPEFNAPQEVSA